MKKAAKIGGIFLLVLIVIGAGVTLVLRRAQSVDSEVAPTTTAVTRGRIEEIVAATGNVAASRQATLTFKTSGSVAEVLVEEGQHVEPGDVLAYLDTASLDWQIARTRASLATAQARLAQARKPPAQEDLASARESLDSAIANFEEIKAGVGGEDLDSAQAALDSARANYERVRAGPTAEDLASAKAVVESARASLQQAQASYDRVKGRPNVAMLPESLALQNATIEMERAQAAYDALANHPTASELASARAQVAQAKAQLAALQAQPTSSQLASASAQVAKAKAQLAQLLAEPSKENVAVAEAQVEEAAIALEQVLDQRNDAEVRAPFGATVLQIRVREGEWASPGVAAIVLATTETLVLDVNVDEVDVAKLTEGQVGYLSFDALSGEEIDGRVTRIAPSSTNVGGAVAYAVQIEFAVGDLPIRLGMTADVDVVVASAQDALLIPNRAIEADREAGRYYVTRRSPLGISERIEVRVGLRDEAWTQILEGLKVGDLVVLPELPGQSEDPHSFMPGQGRVFGRGSD